WSKSAVWGTIKHSTETISRKFNEVLNYVVAIVIVIPIMCPPYLRDIRTIFLLKMRQTHQLQNQVTTPWIGSVIILRGQSTFLDPHD
ncbi:hypothetical protein EJB05_27279, partial [Eragrostis curvula]